MSDDKATPTPAGVGTDHEGPGDWRPAPEVADLVAAILARAWFCGPGMDGRPRFRLDTGATVTLTRAGVRRLIGRERGIGPLAPWLTRAVLADLRALAAAIQLDLDAVAIARTSDALAAAREAARVEWERAGTAAG